MNVPAPAQEVVIAVVWRHTALALTVTALMPGIHPNDVTENGFQRPVPALSQGTPEPAEVLVVLIVELVVPHSTPTYFRRVGRLVNTSE